MFFPLFLLMILFSVAAYAAAGGERKGVKFALSLILSLLSATIIYGTQMALVAELYGIPAVIPFIILPAAAFVLFQLLLYDIKSFG
ncbi:hypothetical protein CR205_12345 [Alteribacter lacisalsi]|uniref:Uncharacterized protein n=1 Tax=Alteribacter lacisalsi TaxID=2045244 RepID=A0A2W0H6A5_9BACI|nr:hypothetical protein [Alteribacter lacisalsi]PYZ96501.1 hypothetical protein CR205_12345 [Alteribacter lacisalsi]